MNKNPAGTPNPLNPVAPSEPIISTPVAERASQGEPRISGVNTATEEPEAEIKKPGAEKPAQKKSKKPVIITAIVLILLAIGAAVAAILILNPFGTHDAVPAAISKLFTSGMPENVKMSGTVTTFDNNKDSVSPSIMMNFSTEINTKTGENIADATVNATLPGSAETLAFNVNEIHTQGSDLYLKLGGVAALKDFSAVFETIDDEWIKIQDSEFSGVSSMVPTNTDVTCLIDAAGKLGQYGNDFVAIYNANSFVEYSTADINIDRKSSPLYRLYFSPAKLAGFVNSLDGSGFANELMACAGETAVNEDVTEAEMIEVVKSIPTIYVEIDDKDNFTRVYLSVSSEDGLSGAVADISFEYPASAVKIEEPEHYITLGEFLAQLLTDFFGEDVTE